MLNTLSKNTRKVWHVPLGNMLFVCISLLCAGIPGKIAYAHSISLASKVEKVLVGSDFRLTWNSCPKSRPTKPGPDSLLIVLLDRSSSLIDEPGATVHHHYSTSVTKVLADQWPSKMAVPFIAS